MRVAAVGFPQVVNLGLVAALAPCADLELLAVSTTVDALLARSLAIDVVVLDPTTVAPPAPAETLARLRARGAAVVTLGAVPEHAPRTPGPPWFTVCPFRGGEPVSTLLDTLRAAAAGRPLTELPSGEDASSRRTGGPYLTPREAEVLGLYASGEKADRVARLLGVTRETVLDHIRRIRAKYALADRPAHTKVDLYRRAVEDGLLPAPR